MPQPPTPNPGGHGPLNPQDPNRPVPATDPAISGVVNKHSPKQPSKAWERLKLILQGRFGEATDV